MSNKSKFSKYAVVAITSISILLSNKTEVNAAEQFNIEQSTQEKIDAAIEKNPAIENYVENIVSTYTEDNTATNEEFNKNLVNSVEGALEATQKTEQDVEMLNQKVDLEMQNGEQANQFSKSLETDFQSETRAAAIPRTPIEVARANWQAGIAAVSLYGHKQTASYMQHATVPANASSSWRPKDYISHNDAWAKRVALDDGLNGHFAYRAQQNIAAGKSNFTIKDSYAYTNGEPYTALNIVNYSITFTKGSNGYKTSYFISDTYDFEWNKYNNILVDFANNYAHQMQQLGQIRPYEIYISYVMQ